MPDFQVVPASAGRPLQLIAAERRRQVEVEGWTPEHDDAHGEGELAAAAGCYALSAVNGLDDSEAKRFWPWEWSWWKPVDKKRALVKAGALIVAELERLIREEEDSSSKT